jgi:hypothetical protein
MQQKYKIGSFLLVLSLLLAACKPSQADSTPTIDPAALKTAAAQTASAYMTATALVPTKTTTPTMTITATVPQATSTATITPTPTSQGTPTAVVVLSQGERAQFVTDVTIPDGTDFKPGDVFTKTWRLKNAGTSTWTAGYALVFISGDKMGGPDRVGLLAEVLPGSSVDISVNLVAPNTAGKYTGYWKLLSTSGKYMDDAVYVQIDVLSGNTPTVTSTSSSGTSVTSTPTVSPTMASLSITNATMSVDTAAFTGACPKTFTFTARFTLNVPTSITYKLEAGSSNPAFTFTLPAAQTSSFAAGEQAITFVLDLASSVDGWARLHITAPVDLTSTEANFSLTCQP